MSRLAPTFILALTVVASGDLDAVPQELTKPAFEVVSVKPGDRDGFPRGMETRGDTFVAMNVSVRDLFRFAYDVRKVEAPADLAWFGADRFTIVAKPTPGLFAGASDDARLAQIRLMVQLLLDDRFKLAVHRESRLLPMFELVVMQGGSRLQTSKGPSGNGGSGLFATSIGDFTGTDATLASLVHVLSEETGQPVIDKTGLTGRYDFRLTYSPATSIPIHGEYHPPSVFGALQEQLSLRLDAARGRVDVVVIDSAERPTPD